MVYQHPYYLCDFSDKDLKEKVNILVTEIFDSELIGEGVLPTLRHAHQNLLQVCLE